MNFDYRVNVELTFQADYRASGMATGSISYILSPNGSITVPPQRFEAALRDVVFDASETRPLVNGLCRLRVEEWGLETDVPAAVSRNAGGKYNGNFALDDVPEALRAEYEKPPQVTLEGNRPSATGTIGVEPEPVRVAVTVPPPTVTLDPPPSIRSPATTASKLAVATGHIEDVRGFIRELLAFEELTEFERKSVELLQVDVEMLRAEMNAVAERPDLLTESAGLLDSIAGLKRYVAVVRRMVNPAVQFVNVASAAIKLIEFLSG